MDEKSVMNTQERYYLEEKEVAEQAYINKKYRFPLAFMKLQEVLHGNS